MDYIETKDRLTFIFIGFLNTKKLKVSVNVWLSWSQYYVIIIYVVVVRLLSDDGASYLQPLLDVNKIIAFTGVFVT